VDPRENTRFGEWLSETYGVMIFDFSVKGNAMINMIEYIKYIITNFPEESVAIRMSPGPPFYSWGQILVEATARRTNKGISSCLCLTPHSEH
jgi:hypothetical protein